MPSDGFGGAGGGDRRVRDVEGGLGGVVQQPGLAVAGEDIALATDDGGDVRMPVRGGELVGGIEDGDSAAFVAVATFVVAVVGLERRRGRGAPGNLLEQGRLVVLDLDDRRDVGLRGDLEMFF